MRDGGVCWSAAALFALVACAGDDNDREPLDTGRFEEWDSAGVRIVVTSGDALETMLPWTVNAVPNLELGHARGQAPVGFERVAGMAELPEGGLVVVDGGRGELQWFEASGERTRTTGGPGEGPGEFLSPLLVPQFHTDSLLIFDRSRRIFTWVTSDGLGARRLGPGGPLFAGMPRASDGSRVIFHSAASGSGSCAENEGCEVPLLLVWVDVAGTVADTLDAHVGRMLRFTESGPPVLLTGPLDQKGLAAVAPVGPVVEGHPRFELRQFDPEGRLRAIFRVDASAPHSPQDALERYVQKFPDPGEMKRIFEMMGLPEVIPAFQDLRVDRLGWYWAQLFGVDEGGVSRWLVFDPKGRARGIVEVPKELAIHEIGENYIIGRWTDELGIEYVRRHALERRGS